MSDQNTQERLAYYSESGVEVDMTYSYRDSSGRLVTYQQVMGWPTKAEVINALKAAAALDQAEENRL